jgi:osmotically-inducible protein OsmY
LSFYENEFVETHYKYKATRQEAPMFPAQISQTTPDESLRCKDFHRLTFDEPQGQNENSKADEALAQKIDHALWKDDVLRAMDYREIDVLVKNRFVYLSGHIVSTTSKNRIEKALRSIPGILGLRNSLVMDDKLTVEVASSLGRLEHTFDCKFFTGVSHGVVTINGNVPGEDVKLLAEQCAASHPDVRGVINLVRVKGDDSDLQDQPLLQPTIGEEIIFLDGVSGIVRQVVINPNNRRVVAMALWGRFVDQRQELKMMNNNNVRSPERLIILSMDLVRYITKFSGFLTVNSNERNRYVDFDPALYSAPTVGWVPPYPYCPGDVLFPADYRQADREIANIPNQVPSTLKIEAQALNTQLLANDSLGG